MKPEATALRFVSFDGEYTESLTLAQARRPDVLVAYQLEGEPLSSQHGGPARLYVAPMYGYKSCKWLETIELTAQVEPGYWEHYGYDVDGWVGQQQRPRRRADIVSSRRRRRRTLPRFDRVERVAHWCTATLMLMLLFTGFSLYVGPLSTLVGRRRLVRTIHVYSGLLLPIPVLVAIALRAGRQLRADLGRLNRWTARRPGVVVAQAPRASVQLGKFNPGQKLNATFIGAAIVVMLMTGSIMRWYEPFSDSWRQGATFVHDWFAIGLLFAIIGHIALVFRDPDALNGMVRGWVERRLGEPQPPALVRGDGRCQTTAARRRPMRSATLAHASHEHGREAGWAQAR